FCIHLRPPTPPPFPYTTLFRSVVVEQPIGDLRRWILHGKIVARAGRKRRSGLRENSQAASSGTVGVAGFEPTTSSTRTRHATKLRHTPMANGPRQSLADPFATLSTGSLAACDRASSPAEPASTGWPPAGRRTAPAHTEKCRDQRKRATTCPHPSGWRPGLGTGRDRNW